MKDPAVNRLAALAALVFVLTAGALAGCGGTTRGAAPSGGSSEGQGLGATNLRAAIDYVQATYRGDAIALGDSLSAAAHNAVSEDDWATIDAAMGKPDLGVFGKEASEGTGTISMDFMRQFADGGREEGRLTFTVDPAKPDRVLVTRLDSAGSAESTEMVYVAREAGRWIVSGVDYEGAHEDYDAAWVKDLLGRAEQ